MGIGVWLDEIPEALHAVRSWADGSGHTALLAMLEETRERTRRELIGLCEAEQQERLRTAQQQYYLNRVADALDTCITAMDGALSDALRIQARNSGRG